MAFLETLNETFDKALAKKLIVFGKVVTPLRAAHTKLKLSAAVGFLET